MKQKLTSAVMALAMIATPLTLQTSCTKEQLSDAAIITAVTVATSTGLKFAVPDEARRTVIADYLDVYAVALRSITGNPTPEQLTELINRFIPQDIKDKYPELITFGVPLIVGFYKQAYDRWGSEKAVVYLNDIAQGIEAGCSGFISRH